MARDSVRAKVKAAAIADLLTGEQPAIVAERYKLNPATVRTWKARLEVPFETPVETDSVSTGVSTPPRSGRPVYLRAPQRDAAEMEIADLVLQNLRAKLIATQRIAEYAANTPAWLEKQTAADVGDLFEHIDRSALAILDRMATAGRSTAAGGDDDSRGADQS